jgi:hypothetical protein
MGWNYIYELHPSTGVLFIPQIIYECGDPRWNDADSGKSNKSEKNQPQCHFVYKKFHVD